MIFWEIPKQNKLSFTDRHELLSLWQWFLGCCEQFHGITGIPQEFSEEEGKIREHNPVDEEDSWLVAAEYNYYWRTQELIFSQDGFRIEFLQNSDIFSEYIRFSLERPAQADKPYIFVKLRIAPFRIGEAALDCPEPLQSQWKDAILARTTDTKTA